MRVIHFFSKFMKTRVSNITIIVHGAGSSFRKSSDIGLVFEKSQIRFQIYLNMSKNHPEIVFFSSNI